MEVVVLPEIDLGEHVAEEISALLSLTPDAVLGLATGSSPQRIYNALAARVEGGAVSFRRARAFLLDEYVGLPHGHPCSYRAVIDQDFVSRVDFTQGAVATPDGNSTDLECEAAAYEKLITDAGGVDLQLLGIGTHGHIAFNEPGSSFASRTRVKALTAQTRLDNARFFAGGVGAVPRHCLTQGIATIMEARRVVLVATGESKAEAVQHMVEGGVSAFWPATILQHHPSVEVVLDAAAASRLDHNEYYANAYAMRQTM